MAVSSFGQNRFGDVSSMIIAATAATGDSASSSCPYPRAPPMRHVSPFLQSHEDATRAVLAQIHPDLGLTRSALTVLLRLQDRLAHFLLHRAFYGEGEEQDSQPSFTYAPADDSIDAVHRVRFRFPSRVSVGELQKHADSERVKAMARLQRNGPTNEFSAIGLQFGQELAERWINDFAKGINKERAEQQQATQAQARAQAESSQVEPATSDTKRETESKDDSEKKESTLHQAEVDSSQESISNSSTLPLDSLFPKPLRELSERVSLCASVEYITAEVLELAGNRALDRAMNTLSMIDLWCGFNRDEELFHLARFLPIEWKVDMTHISAGDTDSQNDAHLSLSSTGAGCTSMPTIIDLLESEFAGPLKCQSAVNQTSWYFDPDRLATVAKQFARGQRAEHEITRSLRAMHVRPKRFWGCDTYSILSERPTTSEDADEEQEPSPAMGFAYVSFTVADKCGEEFHLMLEVSPRQSWRGCLIELHWLAAPIGNFHRIQQRSEDVLHVQLGMCAGLRKPGNIAYTPHDAVEMVSEEESALELQIMAQIAALRDQLAVYTKQKAAAAAARQTKDAPPTKSILADKPIVPLDQLPLESRDANTVPVAQQPTAPTPTKSTDDIPVAASVTAPSASVPSSHDVTNSSSSAPSSAASSTSAFNPLSILSAAIPMPASASASSIPPPPTGVAPRLTYASTSRLELLAASLSTVTQQVSSSHAQTELERIVPHLIHLIRFSHYGPTLYTDSHPTAAVHRFTTTLLDEAMATTGLQPLPNVLLDIVAQYVPLDLPYCDDLIQGQLGSSLGLPFPSTRALYPGQRNSVIERHDQLATELDEVLEPFGGVHYQYEDEEDEEDEDGEDEEEDEDGEEA